jgi:hypothetical protein
MGFPFSPVDQLSFAFQHTRDRQDAVVMWLTWQSLLYLFDRRLAHLLDDLHDLQPLVIKSFRGFSRRTLSLCSEN